jgi:RNA polymerase sigma-70 factor (ECF subfamily)
VRTRAFRARALLRAALAREIDVATVEAFGFAGERCDRIVAKVLARITEPTDGEKS